MLRVPAPTRRGWLVTRPAILSLGLVSLVFAIDLNLPLGVASAVPYTFAVLLALKAPSRWFAPAVAVLCGVLTMAKMELVPERGTTEMWKVVVNRSLALFAIGMTTFLGMLRRRAEAERERAEERVREHLADLAHMGRLKTAGQLAAGLAHELNQPLAAVCLQAEIAARLAAGGEAERPAVFAALGEIAEQSQRAAAILQTLRRMIRRAEPRREPVDVNAVVRAVAGLLDREARRAEVEVRLRLAEALPPVTGDRVQLEQVVFNLLQNAVEAAGTDGDGHQAAWVETARDGHQITVTVRDSGAGLDPQDAERVFERFYTTKPQGMGMGLAISRSIVEAHGGRLWAASAPDRGSAFTFHLPTEGSA
jgi:C4-dicarboxylate-specific signal transduction histidine kinase